jgi:hypothetical protein
VQFHIEFGKLVGILWIDVKRFLGYDDETLRPFLEFSQLFAEKLVVACREYPFVDFHYVGLRARGR